MSSEAEDPEIRAARGDVEKLRCQRRFQRQARVVGTARYGAWLSEGCTGRLGGTLRNAASSDDSLSPAARCPRMASFSAADRTTESLSRTSGT